MEREENNLFKYATKELSQDAFICWCINFINYQDNKEIGKKMLQKFLPVEIKSKIDLNNTSVEIKKQFLNIDILLIINKKYFVIVEDKTDTVEHNVRNTNKKQLSIYKEKLIKALKKADVKSKLEIEDFDENNIYTVYLKTGEQNEKDRDVEVDVKLNARDILQVIDECLLEINDLDDNTSYILSEYNIYLHDKIDLYDDTRSSYFMNKGYLKMGTKFGKKYQCINCFAKYLNFSKEDVCEYTKEYQYTYRGTRNLNKISSKKICVWIPRYYNNSGWINKVNNEENIIEEYKINNNKKEKVKFTGEENKYRYVFVRRNDIYGNELFEFAGLYYIDKNNADEYKRIWKKYEPQNKMVSLNAEEMEKVLEKEQ